MIYPWQSTQWQQLQHARNQNRLPHALLFAGIAGTGKTEFAEAFSRALLCAQPAANGYACDKCHSCRLIDGRVHPDVRWIEPEKTGQAIKVDQIRELAEFVQQSALQGSRRIVVIHPANNMNVSASNALLKTLEEPSGDAILILICDQRDQLLPTILSRCQTIIFSTPDRQSALTWLKAKLKDNEIDPALLLNLTHGAPLAAFKLSKKGLLETRKEIYQALSDIKIRQADPIKLAANWKDVEPEIFLELMLSWLMDLSRLQLSISDIMNTDFQTQLTSLKHCISSEGVMKLLNYVLQLRKECEKGINLNKHLVAESALIRWNISK